MVRQSLVGNGMDYVPVSKNFYLVQYPCGSYRCFVSAVHGDTAPRKRSGWNGKCPNLPHTPWLLALAFQYAGDAG